MMITISLVIFLFCCWAVFSEHFCDGIITKHLFAFAAIAAMLALRAGNVDAFLSSIGSVIAGLLYWFVKHLADIKEHVKKQH